MNIYLILRSLDTECNKYCIANKITFYESICHFIYTAEKSPDTYFNVALDVQSDGDVGSNDHVYYNSYGRIIAVPGLLQLYVACDIRWLRRQ